MKRSAKVGSGHGTAAAIVIVATASLLAGGAGCATTSFAPLVEPRVPGTDADTATDRARDMRAREVEGMEVFDERLPDGIDAVDGELVVDPARYQVMARVSAKLNKGNVAQLGFWVYDYVEEERWRYYYCAPQVPLSWITMGLWAWVTPFHYPCKPSDSDAPEAVEKRKGRMLLALKKAARAAGGDFLVLTGTVSQQVTVQGQMVTSTATHEAMGGFGYAVRRVGAAAVTPVGAGAPPP